MGGLRHPPPSVNLHERVAEVPPVPQGGTHPLPPHHDLQPHLEHGGGKVPVREPALPGGSLPSGEDPDMNRPDEGLQGDRFFDGAGQGGPRPRGNGGSHELMEDAAQLDPRLEEGLLTVPDKL